MSVVWKYTLTHPRTVLEMPPGANVLSVGEQDRQLVIWVECAQSEERREQRIFNAVNTGDQVPPDRRAFVGTVQIGAPAGDLIGGFPHQPIVWHVYEVES